MYRLCAVIAVRDQEFTVTDVVTQLIVAGLDCVLVDDHATSACADVLHRLTRQDRIFLVRRQRGQPPGSALLAGLREARQLGYTHALQVAADGSHDLRDLAPFVRQSKASADALICGERVSGTPVAAPRPLRDRVARLVLAVSTLSRGLRDPNSGFRIYPLAPVLRLADRHAMARRPDVATEILVRMAWRRQPIYWLPIRTRPADDTPVRAHDVHDRLATAAMHARLLAGMLTRAPQLVWCRRQG